MYLNIFLYSVTTLCLAGTVLNVKKNPLCFWLWSFGNIAWLIYDLYSGLYSRAILDIVQLGFAIWGIIEWRRK